MQRSVKDRGCQIWLVARDVRQSDRTAKGRKCMQNTNQNQIKLFRLSCFNSDVFIEKKGSQSLVDFWFLKAKTPGQGHAYFWQSLSLHSCQTIWYDVGTPIWQRSEAERFTFSWNNSAMTDLLIYVDNTTSCSVIFNSEERDVTLKTFWRDMLMEQVHDVLDFPYNLHV